MGEMQPTHLNDVESREQYGVESFSISKAYSFGITIDKELNNQRTVSGFCTKGTVYEKLLIGQ